MRQLEMLSRGSVTVLSILVILITMLLLQACASTGPDSGKERNLALSSGEDYIGDRSDGGYSTPQTRMQLNSGVDRKSARIEGATPASSGNTAPGSVEGADASGMIAGILGDRGLVDQVSSWLIPKAYAADHGIDERYLIRAGACSLLVADYKKASKDIDSIAQQNGGMVSDSRSEKRGDGTFEGYITIRVPSEKFFTAWNAVREVGDLRDERVTTEDASQEYVTNHSRLKNLIAEREVLEAMLADAQQIQRTQGLKEGYDYLLKTQERLFAVSGQIASTENELNALSEKIVQSTITVNMQEKAATLPKKVETAKAEFRWDLGMTAGEAYQQLLVNVRGFLKGLIWFLITCWTWLIPLVIFIFVGRFIYLKWIKPTIPTQPAEASTGSSSKD